MPNTTDNKKSNVATPPKPNRRFRLTKTASLKRKRRNVVRATLTSTSKGEKSLETITIARLGWPKKEKELS
jgi:hypothetical protein